MVRPAMMLRYLAGLSPLRHALNLWLILAFAVCLKVAIVGGDSSVYRMFAGGSRHWWADQSLYAGYTVSENLDSYRYSPAFAVAFTPFYLLPDPYSAMAWSLLSIAVLVRALRSIVRNVLPGDWPPTREGWFLSLAMVASIVGIWSAQTNALVTALLLLALSSIAREQWWRASLFLAIPVFIKLWPIALVMLLVVLWPRQLLGRFAIACVPLVAIPFLTKPPSTVLWQYHEWYIVLTGPLQNRWPGYRDAWTVWESVCLLFRTDADWNEPVPRRVYMAVQLATSAAVLIWCMWRSRIDRITGKPASKHLLMPVFSIWASWQLLFGPATEQLTYGLLAPAVSWAVLTSCAERRARWLTVAAWSMVSFLPAGDIEKQFTDALGASGKALLPIGVALFVAWLVWHERAPTVDATVGSAKLSDTGTPSC